ncbi:hypothetical protein ACSQ67_016598 [Phaseolus vulgaris]
MHPNLRAATRKCHMHGAMRSIMKSMRGATTTRYGEDVRGTTMSNIDFMRSVTGEKRRNKVCRVYEKHRCREERRGRSVKLERAPTSAPSAVFTPLPPPPISLLEPSTFIGIPDLQIGQSTRVRSFPHVDGNYALHVYIPMVFIEFTMYLFV